MIGLIGEKTGRNSYATVSLKQTIPSLQGRFMETVIASLNDEKNCMSKISLDCPFKGAAARRS